MKNKYLSFFLSLLLVFSLIGCTKKEEEKQEEKKEEPETQEYTEYNDVLETLKEGIKYYATNTPDTTPSGLDDEELLIDEAFVSVKEELSDIITNYRNIGGLDGLNMYYSYYDIDEDKSPECIIGLGKDKDHISAQAIYTYKDNEVSKMLSTEAYYMQDSYIHSLVVCENKTVLIYSKSNDASTQYRVEIMDGKNTDKDVELKYLETEEFDKEDVDKYFEVTNLPEDYKQVELTYKIK